MSKLISVITDMRLINNGMMLVNVTIIPGNCCLIANPDDCEVSNFSNRTYGKLLCCALY